MRPQMGTQFFMEGPNWDPISVTRDPIVDPNVAPIGDPIWDPIVFCGQLRTKSFVKGCGVGWGGLFGGVAADVNSDEFHVIWVHNWISPKTFLVPIRSLQTELGLSEAGSDNDEVR